jgi:hypothetical protein
MRCVYINERYYAKGVQLEDITTGSGIFFFETGCECAISFLNNTKFP